MSISNVRSNPFQNRTPEMSGDSRVTKAGSMIIKAERKKTGKPITAERWNNEIMPRLYTIQAQHGGKLSAMRLAWKAFPKVMVARGKQLKTAKQRGLVKNFTKSGRQFAEKFTQTTTGVQKIFNPANLAKTWSAVGEKIKQDEEIAQINQEALAEYNSQAEIAAAKETVTVAIEGAKALASEVSNGIDGLSNVFNATNLAKTWKAASLEAEVQQEIGVWEAQDMLEHKAEVITSFAKRTATGLKKIFNPINLIELWDKAGENTDKPETRAAPSIAQRSKDAAGGRMARREISQSQTSQTPKCEEDEEDLPSTSQEQAKSVERQKPKDVEPEQEAGYEANAEERLEAMMEGSKGLLDNDLDPNRANKALENADPITGFEDGSSLQYKGLSTEF